MTLDRENKLYDSAPPWHLIRVLSLIMLTLQYSIDPLLPHAPLLDIEVLAFEPTQPLVMPWRMLTTHVIHLSWLHLLSNLLVFLSVYLLVLTKLPARALLLTVLISMLAAAWLPAAFSQQASFAGFSAVTHGLVALAAVRMLSLQAGRDTWIGAAILVSLIIKVVWELNNPDMQHTLLSFSTAAFAHAGGLLGGALSGVVYYLRQRG